MGLQHAAQEGQRQRALLFKGIAVERGEDRCKRAHVARRAGKQIVEGLRGQRHAALASLGGKCCTFLGIGKRAQAMNLTGAEPRAQVLAQRQLKWRYAGSGEQAAADGLEAVEAVEQRDLALAVECLHIVDGDEGGVLGQPGQGRIVLGVGTGGTAGCQQVGLAGTGISPQEQAGVRCCRSQPAGEPGQRLGIAAGGEILQRRRLGGDEVKDELAHGRVLGRQSCRRRHVSGRFRVKFAFYISRPGILSPGILLTDHAMTQQSLSYRDAGVDIDAGDALVDRIKPFAKKTMREGVLGGIGGFGALFEVPKKYREPVLVSGTDGVGTKLKLAFELNRHDTVGIDLVAMSVNDILVQGAEPLFFLDYFACGKLHVDTAASVVQGIAKGCEISGCALIGGETAEMPGMYPDGEYDLAGFAVGVVEKSKIIDGSTILPGDVVIGLASSGAHSNGYSLVRKIIERSNPDLGAPFDGDRSLADAIMAPTHIYVKPLLALMNALPVKGMAHITGGGLTENVPRVLPPGAKAVLQKSAWQRPKLFDWLQQEGGVAEAEMHRVFNCGIGMVVIVAQEHRRHALDLLHAAGEKAAEIGTIEWREGDEAQTIVV